MPPKPVGQPTRGFTAPNRLRLADTYLLVAEPGRLRRASLFIDLGFGAAPVTTIESFERFRRVNPALSVVGVEIDACRVQAALPFRRERLDFREGGFNLPLAEGERPTLVRAFNVLRQYPEEQVPDALWTISRSLPPGALLMEGTSDPPGRHVCFWLWERTASALAGHVRAGEPPMRRATLVFGVRHRPGFSPRDLQPFLPRELIHHAGPGGAADAFFGAWERAWMSHAGQAVRERWRGAALALARRGYRVDCRPGLLSRSLLALRCTPADDAVSSVFLPAQGWSVAPAAFHPR